MLEEAGIPLPMNARALRKMIAGLKNTGKDNPNPVVKVARCLLKSVCVKWYIIDARVEHGRTNMQTIGEDIASGNFKQIYLLYGEEDYLIRQYRDQLTSALTRDLDSMNVHVFNEDEPDLAEIVSLSQTLPFFADRRVIVVNSRTLFQGNADVLSEALALLPDTTYMIFATSKADKRTRLFKAVSDAGSVVECTMPGEDRLRKWIGNALKKDGLLVTNDAVDLFIEYTGSDMENMRTELEKLACYCMGKDSVTSEDVRAVCIRRVQNKIFEMIEAIGHQNTVRAMELYGDLLALKEPPMRILALLGRHFNQLLTVKQLRAKGLRPDEIAGRMESRDFIVRKLLNQASDFDERLLRRAVEACAAADEDVKTGRMTDRLSVEMIIVRYSMKQAR